ncbi:hypothetical protein D3C80_1673740 [compost metagenome]
MLSDNSDVIDSRNGLHPVFDNRGGNMTDLFDIFCITFYFEKGNEVVCGGCFLNNRWIYICWQLLPGFGDFVSDII